LQLEELNSLRAEVSRLSHLRRDAKSRAAREPSQATKATTIVLDEENATEITPRDSASQAPRLRLGVRTKQRRYRDLEPFSGKSLKEAKIFITQLETIFQIDPITYKTDIEKVLFRST
jgi:hypothetical protein